MSFTASELKDISKNWAQERTLGELRDKMASNNSILAAIAKEKFNLDAATIRSFEDAIDDAKDGLTELQNSAEKAKRAQVNQLRHEQRMQGYEQEIKGNYKRSVDDLRSSLDKMSRFDSSRLYEGVTSGINSLSYNFRKADGSATGLSTAFAGLNKVVAVVAAGVGIFASGMPAFQAMANTGVTFGGSLEKMQEMVGRTGLKLEEFQGLVGQFGTTIGGVGEENFAKLIRATQTATREFGMYGQTSQQQAESVSFFVNSLVEGGLSFQQASAMNEQGTAQYLRELTALTILTGKDRKTLEARQKELDQDRFIRLRVRQLEQTNPEAAATFKKNTGQLAMDIGPKLTRAIAGMQYGLMPPDEQMRAFMSIGGTMSGMEQLSRQLTSGSTLDMMEGAGNLKRNFSQGQGLNDFVTQAYLGSKYAGAGDIADELYGDAARAKAAEAQPGGMQRILDIFTGRGGNLDQATTAMQKVTMDTARITGDFKAALWAATQQLGLFTKVLEPLAAATGAGAGAANSFYGMAASGMSGAASALMTGAAVALMPKLLASTALKAAIPRLLGGGGLGLTSMLGSTGMMSGMMGGAGNLAARGGLLGMTGNRLLGSGLSRGILGGGLGGLAGGMAGAGLGSMLGLGSFGSGALGVLGGAAGGFLMGGPVGALVGGLGAALPMLISSASASEARPGDQTGNAGGLLQDSTALVEMQASSTSYVSAMAALVSRVAAQATMTSLAPPIAPQNDALLGMVTTLNSTVAAQTPYIQDQARQARITAGIIGDFA
jgi:hypothetical protein